MLLVYALAASGDRAAALATFDEFGRRLGEELGVDPSAEALTLRQRVLLSEIRTEFLCSACGDDLTMLRLIGLRSPS